MKYKSHLLNYILLCAAAHSKADSALPCVDPRFGVMTHFAHGWDPSWVASIPACAISEVRDELYWKQVEPKKGAFVFPAKFGHYMAELRKYHIEPLIILDFENENYDNGDTPYTDEGINAYARYAVEVLRHYGPQIHAVEVWNEYNGTFCKGPATKDRATAYLRLLRQTYAAIKRERPDVTVVGGVTAGLPMPYWEKLMKGGALDFMDALSVHPYRYEQPPEGVEEDIARLQGLVEKYNHGQPKPIWVTEIGWGAKASAATGYLSTDEVTQAKFLVRAYALLLSAGVERIYWYLLHDYQGLSMGLIRDDAHRELKPACAAMSTMIRQLCGAKFIRRDPTPPRLYSLLFARPSGEEVRVIWSLDRAEIAANDATSAADLMGKPIANVARLAIDDSPIFVNGKLSGLPSTSSAGGGNEVLADSAHDFSDRQGASGWTYGFFKGEAANFTPLARCQVTDWNRVWTDGYPFLSVTAGDQHPSVEGKVPVAAVRRWQSDYDGPVQIAGQFRCGAQGDGVGVSILVDGRRRFRKLVGGGNPGEEEFRFSETVRPGTRIDFVVDPGPAADINFDATAVSVVISKEAPHG